MNRRKLFLLMMFPAMVLFSCSEIPSADTDETEVLSRQKMTTTMNLPDGGVIPVPDIQQYRDAEAFSRSKSNNPPKLYNRVIVKPGGEVPGSNGAPVVGNLQDAVDRTQEGGTIVVWGGEYGVDEPIVINRAMTIEPKGTDIPVIRNTGRNAFIVMNVSEGVVTFSNLRFENAGAHSSIWVENAEAVITGSSFDATGGTSGAFAWTGATLTVEESTFTGGLVGLLSSKSPTLPGEAATVSVSSSTFSSHGLAGVQFQSGANGTVSDNTISDCGIWGCSRAIGGGMVDMVNNRFSENISMDEVIGYEHHVVYYNRSSGTVSNNLFDGCGHGQCIAVNNRSVLEITENRFNVYEEHHTRFVIAGSDGTGGTDVEGSEVDVTVTDNTITGIGGNYGDQPWNSEAYAIKLGALLVESGSRMTAHGNTIENANMGFSILSGGILTLGEDNTIQNVHTAVAAYDIYGLGPSTANLHRNDFAGYQVSIMNDGVQDSELTCNWWGTSAGPQNVHDAQADASLYTPWATAPVAGTGATSCTGGL